MILYRIAFIIRPVGSGNKFEYDTLYCGTLTVHYDKYFMLVKRATRENYFAYKWVTD